MERAQVGLDGQLRASELEGVGKAVESTCGLGDLPLAPATSRPARILVGVVGDWTPPSVHKGRGCVFGGVSGDPGAAGRSLPASLLPTDSASHSGSRSGTRVILPWIEIRVLTAGATGSSYCWCPPESGYSPSLVDR